ncbi:MAG: hypothetical protein IPP94_03935 [Ignavibacteria bacterium]|nr:hypothetical protein [Ignavibacteria bacterium]
MKNFPSIKPYAPFLGILCLFAAVLAGCSGDAERVSVKHFHYPTWTSDGKYVVSGYQEYTSNGGDESPRSAGPNMIVREVGTRISTAFHVPGFEPTNRFFLDPADNIAAATPGGLLFVSRDGVTLGALGGPQFPVVPALLSFDPAGGAYFWAGSGAGGRLVVGSAQYGTSPWQPGAVQVLKDTVVASALLDIARTSGSSCAIRLSDGAVREYSSAGDLLSQFTLRPITHAPTSLWQTRMHLIESGFQRKLYVIEDSGLVTLNLDDRTQKLFVKGRVPNFAVSPLATAPFMVFETQTGDTWLATRDGSPLSRLAPQSIMPSLAPNGKWISVVARLNQFTDSLNIFQFSN